MQQLQPDVLTRPAYSSYLGKNQTWVDALTTEAPMFRYQQQYTMEHAKYKRHIVHKIHFVLATKSTAASTLC